MTAKMLINGVRTDSDSEILKRKANTKIDQAMFGKPSKSIIDRPNRSEDQYAGSPNT